MHITDSKIKEIVLKSDIVAEKDFEVAKEEAVRTNREIAEILVGKGFITEEILSDYLEGYFKTPVVDLRRMDLKSKIIEMIPETFAKSKNVVLFDFDESKRLAMLAMLDPFDLPTIEYLKFKLNADIEVYLTFPLSLKTGLRQYKQKIGEEFNKIIEENISKSIANVGRIDAVKMAEEVPIITILDSIIEHAVTLGSSDIHFEPFSEKLIIRYRIDGIMHEILLLPPSIANILVARIKILAGMQIDIHNAPQDGRFRFSFEDQSVDLRVSVIPTFHGEKAEMRILKGTSRPLSLRELGFSDKDLATIEDSIKKTHGMILVTGPTGSGKTTTLYAVLHILNTPKVSIATIEDPVEYDIPRINQTQVNVKSGITFATGLRSLVRQNPDIIMIGEIRDAETVDIAINSALTGHMVLSTLHTNDAPTAIPRLVDMGAANFLLASTINTVVAQRLIRKICSVCVESYKIDNTTKDQVLNQIKIIYQDIRDVKVPEYLYRGKGCKLCSFTGFRGQIGIYEVFNVSDSIREMIMKNVSSDEIRKKAIEEGMSTMFEDGLLKVQGGISTIDEVLRVVRE